MKTRFAMLMALVMGLGLSRPAAGQSTMQKMLDALSGRKSTPPPAPSAQRESDLRLIEILVELAWFGDPLTFPFYLEARIEGQKLHVRGNVPTRAVHEHALKLAQMNSPWPVADGLKENPRLTPRPTRMSPEQLRSVVNAALRESVPRQARNLQTRCTADGQVAVVGNVDSFEQKLAISKTLRRLHGCTVVINLTRVSYDPDGKLARSVARPAPAKAAPLAPGQPVGEPIVIQVPSTIDVAKNAPTAVAPRPEEVIIKTEPSAPPDATGGVNTGGARLTLAQVQKRIQDACPKAREVHASLNPAGAYKIEIHVREESDVEPILNRVYAIPGLENLSLDVSFVIGTPGKT